MAVLYTGMTYTIIHAVIAVKKPDWGLVWGMVSSSL